MDPIASHSLDFFDGDRSVNSKTVARSLTNRLLSAICITLSLLTMVPLISIIFLLLKKGLPLLGAAIFTELPPAAGITGGGFGNAILGTLAMVGI